MATRSRWVLGAANYLYRNRGLRILITPTPVTFAERRSVLQVLEKYGPVEVFRRTADYQSNYVSVTNTSETAGLLIAASPLIYTLEKADSPDLSFSDLAQPRRLDGTRPTIKADATTDRNSANQTTANNRERRTFRIEIYAEHNYNHAGTFTHTQLHTPWPTALALGETFMSRTLAQSLPNNVAAPGLSRWDGDADTRSLNQKKTNRLEFHHWIPSKIQSAGDKADG